MSWQEIFNLDSEVFPAIFRAYPEVCCIDGDLGAFDNDRNPVELDIDVVRAALAEHLAEKAQADAKNNRASAYATEADPLFFKAQRGEATMDEWNAKVAEIRARYPYGGE